MADGEMEWNESVFETILRLPAVDAAVDRVTSSVLGAAKASAPRKTGKYEGGIVVREKQSKHRKVNLITATDAKSLAVEAGTGNMARAARSARA
ncbi:hypothetical protein [Pseudoclavibacter helvolus]|uniref:hypothetical protein n=1 Tax=Pseudoclavibacter helvolus TaxID=255205 RepID=UPI0037356806